MTIQDHSSFLAVAPIKNIEVNGGEGCKNDLDEDLWKCNLDR